MNLYAYVHNDPLNLVDPTGKNSQRGGQNHRLDPQQVESIKEQIKELKGKNDPASKKKLKELNQKMKKHLKGVGARRSRVSKDAAKKAAKVFVVFSIFDSMKHMSEMDSMLQLQRMCREVQCHNMSREPQRSGNVTVTDLPSQEPEELPEVDEEELRN